ncbi:MAG: hypothetical protein J07HX5_00148 [halophilic archaeon J07HX5]|nr:MAG: hypothetical protein J07HX5_00148 [halophilic archaeon J07HX5]
MWRSLATGVNNPLDWQSTVYDASAQKIDQLCCRCGSHHRPGSETSQQPAPIDYRSHRGNHLEWILTVRRSPISVVGYTVQTSAIRAYHMNICYRWVSKTVNLRRRPHAHLNRWSQPVVHLPTAAHTRGPSESTRNIWTTDASIGRAPTCRGHSSHSAGQIVRRHPAII